MTHSLWYTLFMSKTKKALRTIDPEIYGLYCVCDDCEDLYGVKSDVRLRVQYVGQARYGREERFREHRRNRTREQSLCGRWIRSHGPENIRSVLLESVPLTEIDEKEREWISRLGTFVEDSPGFGKNSDRGGQGWKNREISEETRKKHRVSMLALWQDPEYVARQGEALRAALSSPEYAESRAAVYTEEWRAEQSARAKALWADPAWRQAWLISRCGPDYDGPRPRLPRGSQELLDQMSEIASGLWKNPEYRDKVIAAMNRPEVKEVQSAKSRAKWDRPGYREHFSEIIGEAWTAEKREQQASVQAAKWADPEYAARQREAMSRGHHRRNHVEKDGALPKTSCRWCSEDGLLG